MKNKNKEKFSVLMSVYFKEEPKALDLALNSVLDKQTLKPDELVLVEDGPLTDELYKVVNDYEKKYPNIIKIYPLEKNGGLGSALNHGLSKCSNDLIVRMDSDDVSCEDRFEKQIDYMIKHPEISVLGGAISEFEDDPSKPVRLKNMPITSEEVKKYARFRNPINQVTSCFRKKDIESVGGYKDIFYLEDHYLWSRLLVNNKVIENLPDVLVYVRIGNGFLDRRGNKRYVNGWRKLQNYLYKNKFITFYEKERNMLGMYVITYSPKWVRSLLYSKVLRSKKENN